MARGRESSRIKVGTGLICDGLTEPERVEFPREQLPYPYLIGTTILATVTSFFFLFPFVRLFIRFSLSLSLSLFLSLSFSRLFLVPSRSLTYNDHQRPILVEMTFIAFAAKRES